jgi:putative ABC transport system ATP-binding protein
MKSQPIPADPDRVDECLLAHGLRRTAAVRLVLGWFLAHPDTAFTHADLLSSVPAQGGGPLDRVTLRFPDVQVAQGGTLLLRGRSGSGKSTWLALAGGLRTATGWAKCAWRAAAAPARAAGAGRLARPAIGLLPQKLHLSDALTVADNLALVYLRPGCRATMQPSPARCTPWAWASWRALAGAALGRAGAARGPGACRAAAPRVILADEPTASLDDEAAASALALLQQERRRLRRQLVVATHDRRVAEALPRP